MQTSWFLPAIVFLPLAGSIIIALSARRLSRTAVSWVACGAVLLAFAATLAVLMAYRGSHTAVEVALSAWTVGGKAFSIGLLGDAVSIWFALVVTGVGFLIHVYSTGYMSHERDYTRYFAKLNYFIFAMSLLVLADSLIGMLMGWANVGLASYMLIGFYRERPAAAAAAAKAFIVNMIGEVFMFAGIAAAIIAFGTNRFYDLWPKVTAGMANEATAEATVAAATAVGLLLLVGATAKSAQLPLHVWLPDAMQGPTPVSALIHAATMVTAGVYMVARMYPIYQSSETALQAVAVVGALSALAGAAIACRQVDIKKVLAFSTMSQIGFMFLGNGVGAHSAALFHFMTHAFFKALLFLAAGMVIHNLNGQQDIRRMGGLARRMPYVYGVFLIGALALIGVPPLAGFFSKDEILNAVWATHHPVLWVMGILAAGLTAFYNIRLLSLTFWGEAAATSPIRTGKRNKRAALEASAREPGTPHREPPAMAVPVGILAVLSAVAGWMAIPGTTWNIPEHFMAAYFESYVGPLGHTGAVPVAWWALGVVLAVTALGAWLSWRLYRQGAERRDAEQRTTGEPAGVLGRGFYFDDGYDVLAVRPAEGLARGVAEGGDGRIIDGIIDGLGLLARNWGGRLGWLHSGLIRRYALTMVAGVVAMMAYYLTL